MPISASSHRETSIHLSVFFQFFLNGSHQYAGFDAQCFADLKKCFQCRLPFSSLYGTQMRSANTGKTAE